MIQARILEEISCCWQISLPYHQKILNNALFPANVCDRGCKRLRFSSTNDRVTKQPCHKTDLSIMSGGTYRH